MFLLSVGVDALKIAHLGIRYDPVQWLADVTSLTYRAAEYGFAIVGFAVVLSAAEICRRADKRAQDATPGLPSPRSFRFAIIPGGLLGMIGSVASGIWFRN
jgi:hypothetical protein